MQQRAGVMTEDEVYVSELLVVEAAHKLELLGAVGEIHTVHSEVQEVGAS